MRAGPDHAVARAVLKRHAPGPARRVGAHDRAGRIVGAVRAPRRHGPVTGQPFAPVLEAVPGVRSDQRRARAGGVDIEIGLKRAAVGQDHRLDEAVPFAEADLDRLVLDALDPQPLGLGAQQAGIGRRVPVIGVGEGGQDRIRIVRGRRETAQARGDGGQGVVLERRGLSLVPQPQPVIVERHPVQRRAEVAEGMEIPRPDPRPVQEVGAQADRGCGLLEQQALIKADLGVQAA